MMRHEAQAGPLLEVEHLTMRFGGLIAINDVSFVADDRRITAIIGPNGAGKTTVFNCLTGFYKPTVGRLALNHPTGGPFLLEQMEGYDIPRKARVARTFQNIRLFPAMSVLENLIVAQHDKLMRASGFSVWGLLGLKRYGDAEAAAIDKARYWLDRVGLVGRADEEAGNLPYGDQRRLEIARAMCTEPVLLCLDEPAAGLNPRESSELNGFLRFIRDEHRIGILLIEHDMSVVMEISDHIIVLDYGQKIADGAPEDVRSSLGMVFQHVALDGDLTVTENLRHHAALYGLTGSERIARERDALRVLGLSDRAHERVKTLSGGLARRTDLARVLQHRPRLLLLDEPTTGLDPAARREFWQAVGWLRETSGTAVLVATHLLEEAERCEHVFIMSEGRIVAKGSPEDLKTGLGGETLWLETDDAGELADRIQTQFGLHPRVLGGSVQVSNPRAHTLLANIYEALPGRIVSATVRRPTLEDVYMVYTGRVLREQQDVSALEADGR